MTGAKQPEGRKTFNPENSVAVVLNRIKKRKEKSNGGEKGDWKVGENKY